VSSTRPERLLGIIAVLLLAGAIVAFIALSAGPGVDPSGTPDGADGGPDGTTERAQVLRVVDGDTIVVRIGGREERVRYIGLDAPEVANATAGTDAECGGDEARAANDRLVAGEDLLLERDVSDRDRFGRLLRHAWLANGTWRLIGHELVEAGAVEARSYPPDTTRDEELDAAERRARHRGAGIWGPCR
jgi:micrococcal nuclease